jgi:hypothetical protein
MSGDTITKQQGDRIIEILKDILSELEGITSRVERLDRLDDISEGLKEANSSLDGVRGDLTEIGRDVSSIENSQS